MEKNSQIKYLKDYKKPDYLIDKVSLDFTLKEKGTKVASVLHVVPAYDTKAKEKAKAKEKEKEKETSVPPLFLNGEDIKLVSIKLDGKDLPAKDYQVSDEGLTLPNPPQKPFTLEIVVTNDPKDNTRLMGLYMSGGIYCTQCEPEGFRRITYYLDHPDVMAKFKVTIRADKKKYPVRLSNGNLIEETDDYVVWEDPFAKPCYLFALVAADYGFIEDHFKTMSGKDVTLRIYAAKGKEKRLYHAMASLKRAFKWDEEAFGREYDLDLFNVVAVHDFNVGAMENKSLNIFNEKVLLADPETSTDMDYYNIESVIAHEYFHNWSGDRVTARDWFNLSLKEGLTVYRDSEFSSDVNSRPVERIQNVIYLRAAQFPEDAGPLAHPVRPDSYLEIDNFYTVTIYQKGSEVIRMQEKILGKPAFRKAMDLYFSRHDGQAVTIDDFVKCMEDSSGIDLTQFKLWYSQAGTPLVSAASTYDAEAKTLTLTLTQRTNPTPNQPTKEPFVIPIEVGLLDSSGKEIGESKTIILNKPSQDFVFKDIFEKPVLSLNRGFTSPIKLDYAYTDEELAFLMKHDSDLFNRWEAGQAYALKYILKVYDEVKKGGSLPIDDNFIKAFGSYLDITDDKAFAALALRLPTARFVGNNLDKVDFVALHQAIKHVRGLFARTFKDKLLKVYHENKVADPFDISSEACAKRAIRNQAMVYLGLLHDGDTDALVRDHYAGAVNMTDMSIALAVLTSNRIHGYEDALGDFYWNHKDDPLVINKWLLVQSTAEEGSDVLEKVQKLTKDSVFNLFNPNSVYSLIGGFASNLPHFHATDGSGYRFIGDKIIEIDGINPQIAARLATNFTIYPKLEAHQQAQMKAVMDKILQKPGLSNHTLEIISKIINN